MVWYWHNDRHTDIKQSRVQKQTHAYMSTDFQQREAKVVSMEGKFFNQWCWNNGITIWGTMNMTLNSHYIQN